MRQVGLSSVDSRRHARDQILFDDVLARIVRGGQDRGEILPEVEAEQVGEVLAGMTLDALQRWASDESGRTLRESLEFPLRLVLSAISSGKRPFSSQQVSGDEERLGQHLRATPRKRNSPPS